MNTLKIRAQRPQNVTILQNDFIDRLMPRANGEFVKVYLYILRCSAAGLPLTLSGVADHLRCTEQDVVRALKYWEEEGLLLVSFSPSGVPEEIETANKTGELDNVDNDAAIVWSPSGTYILCIVSANSGYRTPEIIALSRMVYNTMNGIE